MPSTLLAPLPPSLPLPGSAQAPSFDSTQPQTLSRFFNDLEFVFERSQVVDADRKRYVGRYVPYDVEELWTSLPEWSPTSTASFTEFRVAVSALYPEVRPDRKFAYRHLEELVEEWQTHEFSTLEDYGCFYRSFFRISSYLRKKDELGIAEEGRLFSQVFPAESRCRRRLSNRLRLKFPDRHLTDVFTLAELHAAAVYVLQGVEANAFPPSTRARPLLPRPSPIAELREPPVSIPPYPPVTLPANAEVDPTTAVAVQTLEVLPTSSVEEALVEKPVDECHYCGAVKCYIRSCPAVVADISSGQCARNSDGQVILPSGRFVPRSLPGRTMRERVLEWHRCHPDVLNNRVEKFEPQVDTSRLSLDPSVRISRSAVEVFQAPWSFSKTSPRLPQASPSRRAQNTAECAPLEAADKSQPDPAPEWKIRSWSDRVPDFVNESRSLPQAFYNHQAPSAVDREHWQEATRSSPSTLSEVLLDIESDQGLPDEDPQSWRAPCEDPAIIERVVQKILNIPIQLSAEELAACASAYARSPATSVGELEESSEDLQQGESRPSVAVTGRFPILPLFPFNRDHPSLHSQSFTSMARRDTQ